MKNRLARIILILIGIFVLSGLLVSPSCQILKSPQTNIAESNQEIIKEVLGKFDPQIQDYLASIPIVYGNVRTAIARTTDYEYSGNEHIIVSFDWDKTYGESIYWESTYKHRGVNKNDPVFSKEFKRNLLTHEYLHHAEVRVGIDIKKFFEDVTNWYQDLEWGNPSPNRNYVKFILFWNVYGGNGRDSAEAGGHNYPGQGEFAYIGEQIANGGKKRLQELPSTIIVYYTGILREDILIR